MNNATKNHIGKNKTSRRTKTKATAQTIERICGMDEAGKRRFRNPKRPSKIRSDIRTSDDFLKTTFLPKLRENEFLDNGTFPQNSKQSKRTERDFYQSLSQLSEHYTIHPMPTQDFEFPYNLCLSLWNMEQQLKNTIENWQNIRLIQKENKTFFTSEERCDTGQTLFYIPIVPLYKMLKDRKRKKTAQLLLSVCSYLYRNAGISYYRQEDSYLYWMYEMLNDWIEQDEEMEENLLCKQELYQAECIGDIMGQKISNQKNLHYFQQRLNAFHPKDRFDEDCLFLASETFRLYKEYPNETIYRNAHFNNLPKQENLNDDEFYEEETTISMDKYISFFADDKGMIYQNIIDSVNNEFNEYGDTQEPIIIKTFDGNNVTHKNLDFEIRLFDVLHQLSGILSSYE